MQTHEFQRHSKRHKRKVADKVALCNLFTVDVGSHWICSLTHDFNSSIEQFNTTDLSSIDILMVLILLLHSLLARFASHRVDVFATCAINNRYLRLFIQIFITM